ncbi:MAG: carboxypeptidase-like regulatory domain-containing protein [Candidatus Cybelea sp.]
MFAVLLMLSNFFFWPSAVDWQTNQENVAIRGAVIDEVTGLPVPGAAVRAVSPAFAARTVSDSKGEFIFLTLFPGTYTLCADKPGYGRGGCCPIDPEPPPQLFAGFEYGATVMLIRGTT